MTGTPAAYSQKPASSAQNSKINERIPYRIRQFFQALTAKPGPAQTERVKASLSESEFKLFTQMQPSEQAHSLKVWEKLQQHGQTYPALLAAALLHDIGKTRQPLAIWERVLIVLVKAFSPTWVHRRGQETGSDPGLLKKAFIVAAQHPQWGAEMAEQAGSQSLTVNLIRRHQEHVHLKADSIEDQLLRLLQAADDEN